MGAGCCGGGGHDGPAKPTPTMNEQQNEIAKWLRWNVKVKNAPVKGGDKREYFLGTKAVDKLMDSHFHKKNQKGGDSPIIPDRDHAVAMLTFFMKLGLFYRGEREYMVRRAKKIKVGKESDDSSDSETDEQKKDRKKKKYRLALAEDQHFEDDAEALFMWDFEATHPYTWLGGTLVIIVGFLGVLYPLWPSQLRGGVYYLSWGGLGFVGFVIVLAILRTILFALIWLFSGGQHHLWIFPNLTEDVGPIESFMPLYTYKYTGPKEKKKKKKKKAISAGEEVEAIEGGEVEEITAGDVEAVSITAGEEVEESIVQSEEPKSTEDKKEE